MDRIRSAAPPWYSGVMVNVETGFGGGRTGRWYVAEACSCGIGVGSPLVVPEVWWMYATVEELTKPGVAI